MNLQSSKTKNLFLTAMLIVAMALTVVGCGTKSERVEEPMAGQEGSQDISSGSQTDMEDTEANLQTPEGGGHSADVLGDGQTVISFVVVDMDGNETNFEIHTDKETVGDALLEHGLIAGEESSYGLYVKQVNGITADYDVDQTYWAFYINGEYASSGVDTTPVKEGDTYSFKIEK